MSNSESRRWGQLPTSHITRLTPRSGAGRLGDMARPLRVEFADAAYHPPSLSYGGTSVMARGNERRASRMRCNAKVCDVES
jgi:hypothetical protein